MTRSTPVLLLALLALHAACASPPSSGATLAPVAPREGYVTAKDGARIFHRMTGAGPDTIVMIHGGPGLTMDYMVADFEPLARHYALLFYDQRGAGRSSLVSDSAALDAERFVDDLEALRVHFGMERLTLLGHSWGAGVQALYALRHPGRVGRLLLVDALPLRRSELLRAFTALEEGRDSVTRAAMKRWYDARVADPGDAAACRAYYLLWFHPFFVDTTALHRSRGDFCVGTLESRRNKIAAVDRYTIASLGDWDWRDSLRGITAPTVVLHGTADPLPVETAREWAAAIPGARLVLFEGVGHFPYVEAPGRFVAAVDSFMRATRPGR